MTAEHHLIRIKLLSVLFCTEAPHISQTRWSCSPVLVAWSRGLKQPLSESPAYPRSHRSPRLQFPPVSFAPQRCLPAIPSSLGPDMPRWPCLLRLHHHVSSSAAEVAHGEPQRPPWLLSALPSRSCLSYCTNTRFLSCVPPQASAHCLCRVLTQSESLKIYT